MNSKVPLIDLGLNSAMAMAMTAALRSARTPSDIAVDYPFGSCCKAFFGAICKVSGQLW